MTSREACAFGSTLMLLLACNALSGVNNLNEVACTKDCPPVESDASASGGSSSSSASSSSSSSSSSSGGLDGGDGGDGSTGSGKPTYCRGILFYVPFEGNATSKAGQAPAQSGNDVTFTGPGKYGTGAAYDPDDAFFYASPSGGLDLHKPTIGSVAVWIKPDSTTLDERPLFRPQNNNSDNNLGSNTTAPSLWASSSNGTRVGMQFQGGTAEATVGANVGAGGVIGWSTGEFHLMVGTWNSAPAAGAPTMTFFVKNSVGETTAQTAVAWSPRQASTSFVRLTTENQNVDAVLDDFAIWDHELTQAESRELFAATASLGTVCGL